MTKRRLKEWYRVRPVHASIVANRKRIAKRLSANELALLIDAFDATGCYDLYGRLDEYLGVIKNYVVQTSKNLSLIKSKLIELNLLYEHTKG